jgi:citrate lyase subunit beta/citryl-CoA lyase
MIDLATARSLLFVPGDRPERFAKAAASGADQIVLDLEDAVEPAHKTAARGSVNDWLAGGGSGVVRINAAGTTWHAEDLAMAVRHGCPVMLPKADNLEVVRAVTAELADTAQVIVLIETATGVLSAQRICEVPGVIRAAFGSVDLGAELGVDPADRTALAPARNMLVLASAAAGLPAPIDGVTVDLRDEDVVRDDAVAAVRLGFGAKLCVHPQQVAIVNQAFTPAAAEIAYAQAVVDAAGHGGAGVLDGKMIDRPVLERAQRLVARATSVSGAQQTVS